MRSFLYAATLFVISSVLGFPAPAHAIPCATYQDSDGDGYGNPSIPSSNCPTTGWVTNNTDCDDTNSNRYPGNTETVGNNVDNDCDGQEICYLDNDNDNTRSASTITSTANTNCADPGEAPSAALVDCNDSNSAMYPGNSEITGNNVDNDCNGFETCYLDNDNDGYRPNPSATAAANDSDCDDSGEALNSEPTTDCNDGNFNVHPFATEFPADGLDSDCTGTEVCYLDNDNDGYRPNPSATKMSPNLLCTGPGDAIASDPTTDCNDNDDTIYPGASEGVGDEVDSDCDGGEICYVDVDGDGYAPDSSYTTSSANLSCGDLAEADDSYPQTDCNDNNGSVNPGESDICDGIDNDCSGTSDDGACSAGDGDAGSDAGDAGDAGDVGPGTGGDGDGDSGSGGSTGPGASGDSGSVEPTGTDAASFEDGSTGATPPDPDVAIDAAGEPPTGGNPNSPDGAISGGGATHSGGDPAVDAGNFGSPSADGGPSGTEDSSGCSCRVAGRSTSPVSFAWIALLGAAFVRRRIVAR